MKKIFYLYFSIFLLVGVYVSEANAQMMGNLGKTTGQNFDLRGFVGRRL